MTTTYTPEVRAKLEDYLATHSLQKGLGDRESACSVAAINLALTGELTDDIPDCMSRVLGIATINLQDLMPHEMRNSDRYKSWLPSAAGTGRDHEQERLAVLMDWLWGTVLPHLQGLADDTGFGREWRKMCEQRTKRAAADAAGAANATGACAAGAAGACAAYATGAHTAGAAVWAAAAAVRAAARAAARAADAADAAADVVYHAAYAAYAVDAAGAAAYATGAYAADDAAYAVDAAARADFWDAVDPIGVLERMTKVGEE